MTEFVTQEHLLKGAAYALQQSGLLLRDANTLYRSGAYASAVVLAAFGREELGRWKLLLKLRKEVVTGKQLSLDDVKKSCGDHVGRQRAATLSVTLRDTGSGSVLKAMSKADFGSDEWRSAREAADKLVALKKKRLPDDRHLTRMSALYVDPISLTEWNRPAKKVTKEFARDFIMDAANDYSLQQSQWYGELEFVAIKDAELAEALKKWTERPTMLPPEWPTVS